MMAIDDNSNRGDSIQIVKAFVQYHRSKGDAYITPQSDGLHFLYLTELQVKSGTTIGDLLQNLVNGEIAKVSPLRYLPSVHYSMAFHSGGGRVYCDSMPCMLNQIQGDTLESFNIRYHATKIPRKENKAILSNELFTGDILLIMKKPTGRMSMATTMTSALMIGPAIKMMTDEEKKGHTKMF